MKKWLYAFFGFVLTPMVAFGEYAGLKEESKRINNLIEQIFDSSAPVLKERMKNKYPDIYAKLKQSNASNKRIIFEYNNLLAIEEFERIKQEVKTRFEEKKSSSGRKIKEEKFDPTKATYTYIEGMNLTCWYCLLADGQDIYSMTYTDSGNDKTVAALIVDKSKNQAITIDFDMSIERYKDGDTEAGVLSVGNDVLVNASYEDWLTEYNVDIVHTWPEKFDKKIIKYWDDKYKQHKGSKVYSKSFDKDYDIKGFINKIKKHK